MFTHIKRRNHITDMMLNINDLKEDELRLVFDSLSVHTLFKCRSVCKLWHSIVDDTLRTRLTLTLHYNDINQFTSEELQSMCSNARHIPINSSIGTILGKISPFVLQFQHLSKFRHIFSGVFDLCSNVESLHLLNIQLDLSDFQFILDKCPQLKCLSVRVANFMDCSYSEDRLQTLKGIKHLHLKWDYPYGDRFSKTNNWLFLSQMPAIEELVLDMNFAISLEALNDSLFALLKRMNASLKKLHLLNIKHVTNSGHIFIKIIESLCDDNTNTSRLINLNIDCIAFDEMLEEINNRFVVLETLYIRLDGTSSENYRESLKNLKRLKHIHLNFNSMTHSYDIEAQDDINANGNQYLAILSNMNPLITRLTITNAIISIKTFCKTLIYFPHLEQLDTYMVSFEGNSIEFWKIIADFKNLQKLTINLTDVRDNGCEELIRSNSLNTLELVKYNGVSHTDVWISTENIVNTCAQLAARLSNKWITLRLDIDVYEVDQQITRQLPRNLRIINVGFKK